VKDGFVKRPEIRAKLQAGQLALREMAGAMRDRRLWGVILAVVLLVALAGPFYTLDGLALPARIAYWGFVGVPGALLIWALNRLIEATCPTDWPRAGIGAVAGALGILPVTGLVALGMWLAGLALPPSGVVGLLPYIAPTAIGISVLVQLVMPVRDQARRAAAPDGAAGLFARLPPELGRDIIAVQAQDHYVKVFTPLGSRLVLMRMSDASGDLGGLNGMQIHRSWWVSIGHVLSLEKPAGGGPRLTLRNGITVPVPRSRVVAVRRALAARRAIEAAGD
jgi:hypothetical protein